MALLFMKHRLPVAISRRYASSSKVLTLGIRREDKNRWERRVGLLPDHVERIIKELGATVLVQPSTRRVIPDEKYQQAGAIITNDLSKADIILAVKEVPIDLLMDNKTYMFFSHTHKAQKYNMPMLKKILEKQIRLIDYELMTDENKKRLVQFSKFAGYAGMIDGLHGLAHRLLCLGYGTPFLSMGMSYMYRNLSDARLDVTRSGMVIADDGLQPEMGPMTFVFTGDGQVARGALHVFKCLPHEWVSPNDLKSLWETKGFNNHKVYACQLKVSDWVVRKDGGKFERSRYNEHPDEFMSVFHEKIAPYTRMLINGIYWDPRFPRLLTNEQARDLALEGRLPLLTIADISCDINGSIEFMSHATSTDNPFFLYDPVKQIEHQNAEAPGVQIMSVDILPTEMPLESSEHFSNSLFPYVKELVRGNFDHPVLKRATITTAEGLVPRHAKLAESIARYGTPVYGEGAKVMNSRKVLLLGSGFVSAPLVDYLLRESRTAITIASNSKPEADRLAAGRQGTKVAPLDVHNKEALGTLVSEHDVVVSFVPAPLHPLVALPCIQHGKHLVTASYISPAMAELDAKAKAANVTLLNEMGLDPGIDHMTAVRIFDDVRSKGGRITSFVSWCGGLPAPEASDNPLGYKFSWSPRGVLTAGMNEAKFKRNGQILHVPGMELLKTAIPVSIFPGFAMEGFPNRDSLKYLDLYGLGPLENLDNLFRGTLRYQGYSELMSAFIGLGLLDDRVGGIPPDMSWAELMTNLVRKGGKVPDMRLAIASKLGIGLSDSKGNALVDRVLSALKWMDVLSPAHPVPPASSVLDAFCALLQKRLIYGPGERDMVVMHHEVGVELANGVKERRTSTLVSYGDPTGYTAMARTVGLPAAIGVELILNGSISRRGVIAPMTPDVYEPCLHSLEKESVRFTESTVSV
ncbi:hypothetical protein SmJEL517_g02078 [Synchytrium microbalum]|uniref:Uncharacterized protein n=1 Tax=Synchytrium microbalum TaxID=1806994 RepID=A0A507C770_9FUNG|nr:uncharacterized protein SmJEL517_g02078 [Synchytrium microbalum]TPX35462.1 hypothetical protein SmJEL517_g02078 [Synchytrium microbalum]